LNKAIGRLLDNRKSPSRKVNELDNRASNFYIALYWSDFLTEQAPEYLPLAKALADARSQIVEEHKGCQGSKMDVGGYYMFDDAKADVAMRPSALLNSIMEDPSL